MKSQTVWLLMRVIGWPAATPLCCMLGELGTGDSGGDHYWTHGCVSADQTILGAVGDEAAQVDLKSGATRQQEIAYFDEVLCLPDGEVIALSRRGLFSVKEAVWLEEWEEAVGRWRVVRPLSGGQIVTYHRRILTDSDGDFQRYDGPLTLAISPLSRANETK